MLRFWVVLQKELYQRRWTILAYSLIGFAFLWLYVGIYPSFEKESAKFNELVQSYPKALLEAFNIEQLQLTTIAGFISVEHFGFMWPLMAILLMVSTAGQAVAAEIERGTMALLLSLPIGRFRLYLAKYLAGIVILLVFAMFSIAVVVPLVHWTGYSISAANVARVFVLSVCFGWAVYGVSFMVSAWVRERSRVYVVMAGGLILMYVANIASGLVKSLDKLKYVSIFHYYTPDKALVLGQLQNVSVLVFVAVAIVASIVGMVWFVRRDISV